MLTRPPPMNMLESLRHPPVSHHPHSSLLPSNHTRVGAGGAPPYHPTAVPAAAMQHRSYFDRSKLPTMVGMSASNSLHHRFRLDEDDCADDGDDYDDEDGGSGGALGGPLGAGKRGRPRKHAPKIPLPPLYVIH